MVICSTNNQKLSCIFPEKSANATRLVLYFKSDDNYEGKERSEFFLSVSIFLYIKGQTFSFGGIFTILFFNSDEAF